MVMNLTALTKCYCNLRNRVAGISATTTTVPVYEYRDIWAEESGTLTANSAEWSFGNGATGFIGLPIDEGWEVEALYFHADTYAATAAISIDLMNYGNVPSDAAANTIATIELTSATDGGGDADNAYKYQKLLNPVAVPEGVLGFTTRTLTGAATDGRVGARLRRKVADVVTSVTIS